MIIVTVLLISLAAANLADSEAASRTYEIYNEWKVVDFAFVNDSQREQMIRNNVYIPANVVVASPQVYKDRLFICTPRWRTGTPSSLNFVPYSAQSGAKTKSPILRPFPNWEMQQAGNCSAIQIAHGLEVDQYGRLWVIDTGRTEIFEDRPKNSCPAKILVFDLNDGDKIIKTYEFPDDVVSRTTNAVKEIQVACTSKEDCFVYLSDPFDFKVIVFDYKEEKSWSVSHPSTGPKLDKANLTIAGTPISAAYGISGIALAPISRNFATLHYGPIADTNIYAVKTDDLKKPRRNIKLTDEQVHIVGQRRGQSDGWGMTNGGKIYTGNLPECQVDEFQTSEEWEREHAVNAIPKTVTTIKSEQELQWPDTLSFDGHGNLLVITNRFQLLNIGQPYNSNEINFRVVRIPVNAKSYLKQL